VPPPTSNAQSLPPCLTFPMLRHCTLLLSAVTGTAYPSAAALPPFKFTTALYYNARVLKIANQPAWAYISNWARGKPGEYHSVGQRLNDASAHLAAVSFRVSFDPGRFSSRLANPGEDFVTMVVQR